MLCRWGTGGRAFYFGEAVMQDRPKEDTLPEQGCDNTQVQSSVLSEAAQSIQDLVKAKAPVAAYIVTGLSGAGKSTALQVFEDLGYFTVDGLPVSLAHEMVSMMQHESMHRFRGIALGISLYNDSLAEEVSTAIEKMCAQGVQPHFLFLEASEAELLRRYATTRRPHPLEQGAKLGEQRGIGLEGALISERRNLVPIRDMADVVLDTSSYSIHDLRRVIQQHYGPQGHNEKKEYLRPLKVNIISFGFKYGVPKEADVLLDVRFLPNPHFDLELRPLSGKDLVIDQYIFKNNLEQVFLEKFLSFMLFTLGLMEAEGRYRVTLAIGCTGGRHRSVATVERLYKALKQAGYAVSLEHRHMSFDPHVYG